MSDELMDYEALATGVAQVREVAAAMVAGLRDDGFTEEQARRITTHVFAPPVDDQEKP